MLKTSVYLTQEELVRLARIAEREGLSQAEVIRRAIRSYQPQRPSDRNFAVARVADGPGGSVADLAERDLLDGFGS